ncbi:MAG TPA: GNAT family protein [Patescibacteria group bacterium]|nr:GNAT family protein [Patescibacteria group bacterium]
MILKGQKTILRPIKISDTSNFVKWSCDSNVNKFTTRRKNNKKEIEKWIKGIPKDKTQKQFAIETREGKHIGSTQLLEINPQDKNALFAILIGDKDYWSSGYGYDASKSLINYAFKKMKLHKLYLNVYDYNKRAIGLYKKLGFKTEGTRRENIFYNNKFHNEYLMGLLVREWRK